MNEEVLVCHVRPSRKRALRAAEFEVHSLLTGLRFEPMTGGPLADRGGVFWVKIDAEDLELEAVSRLSSAGYTTRVDRVESGRSKREPLRWRGRDIRLVPIHEEDIVVARDGAPDRRPFLLAAQDGVREVRGYRGDGGALSKRGLPVADASWLANTACARPGSSVLDPFAGIGGIVIAARACGALTYSVDIDPKLEPGLQRLATQHVVGDARRLPFPRHSFDAVATEPPFETEEGTAAIVSSVPEIARVLKPHGRLSMMVARAQWDAVRRALSTPEFHVLFEAAIDRKGTAVQLVTAERTAS